MARMSTRLPSKPRSARGNIPSANSAAAGLARLSLAQIRDRWKKSLGFRLLALGLMPLLLAFPMLLGALALLGGNKAEMLLQTQLNSKLAATDNYLDQFKDAAAQRVMQLAKSWPLASWPNQAQKLRELERELENGARTSGFDFLALASESGQLLACSTPCPPGVRLPDSFVLRQARDGVSHAAVERHPPDQLVWLGPVLTRRLQPAAGSDPAAHGLLVHAAAHLPLAVEAPDAILFGAILLNRNNVLLNHLRELIFPIGSLPEDSEGLSLLLSGQQVIAASQQRQIHERELLGSMPDPAASAALLKGNSWLGRQQWGGQSFMAGYAPIRDGEGHPIGMVAAAFPDTPYTRMTWWLLGSAALLLALTMLGLSAIFLRAGRQLAQRLTRMGRVLNAVESGQQGERMEAADGRQDELGQLARHFDRLLDTIEFQQRQQEQSRRILTDEASRRRALFESDRDGVMILDARDGTVLECNPVAAQLLGYPPQEVRGRLARQWLARPEYADRILSDPGGIGPDGQLIDTELRRSDGLTFPVEIAVSQARWSSSSFLLLRLRDITQRKATEDEMRRLATLDGLTGVLNRRAWTEAVNRQLEQARRYRHPVCLLMIDADHFKRINDLHGHAAGDAVLKALTATVTGQLRQADLLGRLGGEEFGILLPETDAEGLQRMGQRLLQAVRDCRVQHESHIMQFTVSIGATLGLEHGPDELETLLKQADDALYRAKHDGRDRIVLAGAALSCPPASCG